MNDKTSRKLALCALTAALLLLPFTLNAGELRVSRHFGDGMVLQRGKPVTVTGFADEGSAVTVEMAGQSEAATADNAGAWRVTFESMPATREPQTLAVKSGGKTVALKNVLIGDVFLFARQTTIDISLGRDAAGRKAAAAHTKNPLYRAISIKTIPALVPQSDLDLKAATGWAEVNNSTALKMSAAAYYFGRDLVSEVGVPIGIIDLNLGYQFPISWLSREALLETEKFYGKTSVEGLVARMEKLADLKSKGEPMPRKEVVHSDPVQYPLYPAAGYNAVIHPLRGLALKGIIVQLGANYPFMVYAGLENSGTNFDRRELNRAYIETYDIRKNGFRIDAYTTPRIPKEWRQAFADKELPIALVMPPSSALHTFGTRCIEMRELNRLTATDNFGVGLILSGSESIPYSAQPRDEVLLASRSLSWARGSVYRKDGTDASGPLFDRVETDLNRATIHFKEGTAKSLNAKKGALDFFEAAGIEGEYSPAAARIDGDVIRIKSDTVNRIAYVRYNWNKSPNQGLGNASGLPAIPFRSQQIEYVWFIRNSETDLPSEYFTPANEWKSGDVTLVNGQLKTHGYPNFSGWIGPVGVKTGPFGPNMGVRKVLAGSPADGKIFEGDVIYSANGNMLGDEAWVVMAAAITESETEAGSGRLLLGVRRDGKNMEVKLTLKVMGTYSSTAPYDCPKTEKIIAYLEEWLAARGGGATRGGGFLGSDALFLLGSGNPKYQGLVRRVIYSKMASTDPTKPFESTRAGKSWYNSADAILFGEYFHATGDRNVLPYLKNACDRLAATQQPIGGWRHNFPGGATYGLIPNAGIPGVIGMNLAKAAGLDINMKAYELGVRHFREKRAETGTMIYGLGGCQRETPPQIDPAVMAAGKLETYNGGLSAAGILMGLEGHTRAAHLCSLISAYAFNNTFGGHGGNFWNNFWTPLGAHAHGRAAFIHFMKGHRWYRECNRMFDGSLINNENERVGGGHGLALVAPRERLRITGAPKSPFATDAPEFLKPALAAHAKKDYSACEKLVSALLATGTVSKADLPRVQKLAQAAREIQQSIEFDMTRMEELIEEGRMAEASADLAQLMGVVAEGNARLAALEKGLKGKARPDDKKLYAAEQRALQPVTRQDAKPAEPREWKCLVTEIPVGKDKSLGKVPAEEASKWRMKVVESAEQAPEGWMVPRFDDSEWEETNLPISWRMYHTALLRTKFAVDNKNKFDGLRMRGWLFRQQGIEIYLNGKLIGKVNNLEKKTGNVEAEFKESVMKRLKNGENTLAVTTRHNWRWGMLFMHVYNDGFGFRLDARMKK